MMDEANRLRLEEENMVELAEQKKNKRKEFMNSSHAKNILAKLALAKRNHIAKLLQNVKPWVEDISRVFHSMDTVWLSDDIERFLGQVGQIKSPIAKRHALIYANGERYTTPWSEVDQVFIPINETDEHWCLAQFHILSGEVTFYDIGDTYEYDYHDWDFQLVRDIYVSCQRLMVRCQERHEQILELQMLVGSNIAAESVRLLKEFQDADLETTRGMMRLICETQLKVQLLVVLERANVFQKNGIDPSKYTITLAHGLSLDVDDPVDIALSYREKIVRFYFKHKTHDSPEMFSLFEVNYDGVFHELPLRYEYGKVLPLKLSNSNRTSYSEMLDMLVYKLECEIRSLFYCIPRNRDIQSKLKSHEKLKMDAASMTFDEIVSWQNKESLSPLLRTPPLKPRRKGIEFQGKNLYAEFLHADCVDDHFDILNYWKYEDVYGDGCFYVGGSFKGFDLIDECVGYNDISLPGKSKDEFSNKVILDDGGSSSATSFRSSIEGLEFYLKFIVSIQKLVVRLEVFDLPHPELISFGDMHTYVSRLKNTKPEAFIATYDIPLDLRPRLPDPNFRMINLLVGDTTIGIYSRIFDSLGVRIPFSYFLLAVLKYFKVHISQLVPLGYVREEPHELGTSILSKVADRTTSPVLAGTAIPHASPKEIDVTRLDYNVVTKADHAAKQKTSTGPEISTNIAKRTRLSQKVFGAGSSGLAAGDGVKQTGDGTLDDDGQRDGSEFAMEDNGNLNDVSQGVSKDASSLAQEAVPAPDTQPLDTNAGADEIASNGNVDPYYEARVSNTVGDMLERDLLPIISGPDYTPYPFAEDHRC
ncbi:phospholipase-like protein [Tanacetum coccineum]